MDGLKKVLRKVAGPVLAVGAIAAGQPELAAAAYSVGSAATKKKAKAVDYVAAPDPVPPQGLFSSLTTADKQALMIGGGVLAAVLLLKGRK